MGENGKSLIVNRMVGVSGSEVIHGGPVTASGGTLVTVAASDELC